VDTIPGAVIDMVSSGNALYVLTFQTSLQNPIINTLYKINFQNTADLMFAQANLKVIAQNATSAPSSDLTAAKMFYAIAVTTAKSGGDFYEELLLATNNGIYRSNKFTNFGINTASDQADALWAPVNPDNTSAYTNIFSVDNPNVNYDNDQITAFETVWPLELANTCNCKTYEKNNITQLSGSTGVIGSTEPDNPSYNPENFNADTFACTGSCAQGSCQQNSCSRNSCCQNSCANNNSCNSTNNSASNCSTNYTNSVNAKFQSLDPINYFWSDGARRFFVIKRPADPTGTSKLFVIPYDIQEWMVTDPKTQVINDPALQNIKNYYWVGPIGVSGITLAGTSTGLVALE
jgi:hypothetical protein